MRHFTWLCIFAAIFCVIEKAHPPAYRGDVLTLLVDVLLDRDAFGEAYLGICGFVSHAGVCVVGYCGQISRLG